MCGLSKRRHTTFARLPDHKFPNPSGHVLQGGPLRPPRGDLLPAPVRAFGRCGPDGSAEMSGTLSLDRTGAPPPSTASGRQSREHREGTILTAAARSAVRGRALLAQAARFLAAGGTATAVHYALLVALVEPGLLPPTPATCVGYATAAALNYGLRRRFVFRSRAPHRRTLPRYLVVLGAGFGLNGGLMALGAGLLGLPYAAVQVVATGLVTAWNFAAHRLWTFREAARAPRTEQALGLRPPAPSCRREAA